MATIKVACPKCGQKVSGDESFYGTSVECPICSAEIYFPGQKREKERSERIRPVPPEPPLEEAPPRPSAPSGEKPVATSDTPSAPGAGTPVEKIEAGAESLSVPPKVATSGSDHDDGPDLPPSPIYGSISIVSAVLAIVTCVGGVFFAPIAIIFGHTALAKARHSPVQPAPGHTLGAIGLLIGYVSLVLTIIVLLALTLFGDALREAFPQFTD